MPIVYDDEAPATTAAPAAPAPSIQYDDQQTPPASQPDKYMQAAIAERDRLLKAGVPLPEGFTRRVTSGPLLGWGDTITAGAMTPLEMVRQGTLNPAEAYRYAKAREDLASQAAQENTGILGDVAETGGAIALMPGNIFARQLSGALGGAGTGVVPALARMAGYGAESGALGAVQGAGSTPSDASWSDMAKNALKSGAVSAALGAPFGKWADVAPRSTAAVPSADELVTLGKRDYRARDRLPVRYDTGYVGDRLKDLQQGTWNKYGLDAPETTNNLGQWAQRADADVAAAQAANANAVPPGAVVGPGQVSGAPNTWQAVTRPRDIASIRRSIYEAGASGTPTDERAGTVASKIFDRILTRPDPASLAQGSPRDAAAAALLDQRGRGNFGAAYRSNAVTNIVDDTLNQAAAAHSGLNFENNLRQNLNKASRAEQFGALTAAEEADKEQLIRGTTAANRLREFGNMLGGGGGLGRMAAIGTGFGAGGAVGSYMYGGDPWMGAAGGLALGLPGRMMRVAGNNRARAAAETFAETLRKRSPEYQSRLATAPMAPGPGLAASWGSGPRTALTLGGGGGVRDAIARALEYQLTGQQEQ